MMTTHMQDKFLIVSGLLPAAEVVLIVKKQRTIEQPVAQKLTAVSNQN